MSRLFRYVVRCLKSRNVILLGDVDDLIFDPYYVKFRPSVLNHISDETKTANSFIKHGDALSILDKIIFSTDSLRDHYLSLNANAKCIVIPNAGHHSWSVVQHSTSHSELKISYFSGTKTHDRDFGIVVPVLRELLNKCPDLKIQIVGPLSSDLDHPRVVRIPKVPFGEYAKLVKDSHINIAPLEDTPFNQCKSALKAIEAGMMNVPTVASPVGEYKKVNIEGVMLAKTNQEWMERLEFLLNANNYERVCKNLRERICTYSDVRRHADSFIKFVLN